VGLSDAENALVGRVLGAQSVVDSALPVGAALGLFVLGMLQQSAGDLVKLIPLISLSTVLAGLLLFLFAETSQRELESLSDDG
jgi:uncharacterized membrane protein